MNLLVVVAHPNLKGESIANRTIIERITRIKSIAVSDLYSNYTDGNFDVEREQQQLLQADLIILQFPLYWYSVPGRLKEWFDQVFTRGFAYGVNGNKLHGKHLLVSTTVGGSIETYAHGKLQGRPIKEYLYPLQQTAEFSGMKYLPPCISYGMNQLPQHTLAHDVIVKANEHARTLIARVGDIIRQIDQPHLHYEYSSY